jgi:hypothetical protein
MAFWSWHPLVVALVLFAIDFGAILLIRGCFEHQVYLARWWTYRVGDSICLPTYGYMMATVIQHADAVPALYVQTWWHVSILLLGYLAMVASELAHVRRGTYTVRQELWPSQLYHSAIFGIMFYLVLSPVPFLFEAPDPSWAAIGARLALLGFAATFVIDSSPLVSKAPEPDRTKPIAGPRA